MWQMTNFLTWEEYLVIGIIHCLLKPCILRIVVDTCRHVLLCIFNKIQMFTPNKRRVLYKVEINPEIQCYWHMSPSTYKADLIRNKCTSLHVQ